MFDSQRFTRGFFKMYLDFTTLPCDWRPSSPHLPTNERMAIILSLTPQNICAVCTQASFRSSQGLPRVCVFECSALYYEALCRCQRMSREVGHTHPGRTFAYVDWGQHMCDFDQHDPVGEVPLWDRHD